MRLFDKYWFRGAVLTTSLAWGLGCAVAQDPSTKAVPDAQVQANVLRQLASATELSTQNIQATTVYGTVTLTGNVHNEAMRSKAENLTARAQGVKKVVDELTLGDTPSPAGNTDQAGNSGPEGAGQVLQSDGSYAPAAPDNTQQAGIPQQGQSAYPVQPGYSGAPEYGGQAQGNQGAYNGPPQGNQGAYNGPPPQGNQGAYNGQPAPQPGYSTPGYGQSGQGGQPGYNNQQAYGNQPGYGSQPGYSNPSANGQGAYSNGQQQAYGNTPPPPPGYGQPYGAPQQRQPMYGNGYGPARGGQVGGQLVTVAAGAPLQVRVDRGFDANHVKPGTPFTGTVMSDIVSNGSVAIPRGAQVQGVVIDAKKAHALSGEAELALQITGLTLGGQTYPLNSDVWDREGHDKTTSTVNHAVGLGVLGAVIGGVAGGGAGAAIGAGVGAGAGVASSAGSPAGRVLVPAETVLNFTLTAPVQLTTVGQDELSRLSYAAGGGRPVPARRYYNPNYGPGYYR